MFGLSTDFTCNYPIVGIYYRSMKLKIKDNQLFVETNIYQASNGAVWLNWSNTVIKLEKDYADSVAWDIPDFNQDDYNKYYSPTETYKCQSFVEGGKVINCTCGKCF